MDNKKPYSAPHMKRPEHHLFANNRLNRLFCSSPDESARWARQCVELFKQTVTELPEEKQAALLTYVVAVTEAAFELGFIQAIDEMTDLSKETKKNSEEPNKSKQ